MPCSGNATALLRGETLVGSLRALLGSGCYHTSLGKLALFALLIVVVGCNGSMPRKRG